MAIYVMIALVFVLGYMAIAFEHQIQVNKAASALLTAIVLWVLLMFGVDELAKIDPNLAHVQGHAAALQFIGASLREHLAEIAEILFFLMGAMAIVELIDAHDGFRVITDKITTQNASKLLWIITILTFFLSSLLDNLTTTIVMISLVAKLIAEQKLRWYFAGMIVIAANAGGAWSPVGDVTTTMLWIGGQITATGIMANVFLPSIVCTLVPLAIVSWQLTGQTIQAPPTPHTTGLIATAPQSAAQTAAIPERIDNLKALIKHNAQQEITDGKRRLVLGLGLGSLGFVPIFKTLTHLPPYVGVLFGLAILWIVTEIMHRQQDDYIRERVGVEGVLSRIDMPSILFFLGILLSVAALATGGVLTDVATWLDNQFGNIYVINIMIGLLSSIIDNVPLVAGAMNMYPLATDASIAQATATEASRLAFFRTDGLFWEFLAYCAGTGGSCLIIGSAAGVAAMGMEKIPFMWYFKRITWLALAGYLAGAGVYVAIETALY